MCGICGFAAGDGEGGLPPGTLERMCAALRHRGPDGEGRHRSPGIELGARRLAIVDLEAGTQPLASEDGAVVAACNGEIYNAPELRADLEGRGHRFRSRSDAEPIVHLYEERGEGFVESLRGMFAIALWDARRRRLWLARDRFGIKPLQVARTAGGLAFASEVKAILALTGRPAGPDPGAVRDLFSFGFALGPRTFFPGVRRVLPGEILCFERGRIRARRYWRPELGQRPGDAAPPGGWPGAVRAALAESVRLHLRSDVPVAVQLSAGVDSSLVAALARGGVEGPLEAFSLAFEDPGSDEVGRLRTLADYPEHGLTARRAVCGSGDLGLLPEAVRHVEDPTVSGIEVPRLALANLAAGRFKVLLTGEGSDEIFGGYPWYRLDRFLRPFRALPGPLRRGLAATLLRGRPMPARMLAAGDDDGLRFCAAVGIWVPGMPERLLAPGLAPGAGWTPAPPPEAVPPPAFARWHPFARLLYLDQSLRLPDLVAHLLDRTTMARSVEARVPFLDHELAELAARIPPGVKMRRLREKDVLRRAAAGLLPAEIAGRKKRGLSAPVAGWLRPPLPAWVEELLAPGALRAKGMFRERAVAALRERGPAAERRHLHLMGVLALQIWDEIFVRGRGV